MLISVFVYAANTRYFKFGQLKSVYYWSVTIQMKAIEHFRVVVLNMLYKMVLT